MTEAEKNPFDVLLDAFRHIVREEISTALKAELNGVEKEWLKADEAARLYGLPKTWFEEKGRAGEIARTKPGRYVLFKKRDVEDYLERCKKNDGRA